MKKRLTQIFTAMIFGTCCCVPLLLQAAEIQHSFFVAGPDFTGIVGEDGKPKWDSGRAGARDGWVLPNGNVLIAWGDIVREFTPEKEVVFEYKLNSTNKEIGTVQRLANGNTLITELGSKPRLLEVMSSGEIAVDVALKPVLGSSPSQRFHIGRK